MKKILVTLLTCVLLVNLITIVPISAAVDNTKYIPKIIRTDEGTKMIFDPGIAKIAREMSVDAYGVEKGSKPEEIAKTMKKEGFKEFKQSTTKWYNEGSNNFLVGVKSFEVDGQKKYVMAIAFKGTKNFKDGVTDALCWDDQGYHPGFRVSAGHAYDTLSDMKFDYLKNEKGKSIKFSEFLELSKYTDDYFLLVTGHSLGGAIANIFTMEFLGHTKTMCYTFGCPEVCSPNLSDTVNAYNIFNIINTLDPVPKIGFEVYNGRRFGTDLTATVDKGDLILNHKIDSTYKEVTEKVISNIDSQYKYTITYYNKLKNEGTNNGTPESNGGETDNSGGNNGSLGSSIVGVVDIPSSWDNLSIRSGPSTDYQIVGSMNDGSRCNVYPNKTKNGWYYVEYNGIYGYASGNQINTSGSSDPKPSTPKPSIPATISFSKSQLNLDYNSHPSETITITASGDLPKSYHLNFKYDSALSVTSGQWNGNSISTTIEMKGGPVNNNKIEVYLKDSSGNIYASNTIYVNATVPVVKQNTEIVLSKDNISIHFPDKKEEKMFVTIEGPILDNSTISIDTNESVTFEWGQWSNNRAELTIQSSRTIPANYTPCGYATIYIKDGNGNIYASKQFNLTSTVAKYAVRYDANGGYDAPDTHYVYHNHWDEKVSSHIPTREGYKFEGWSTSRNGKVEYGRSQQLMTDHDIVFYAVWEKNEEIWVESSDDEIYLDYDDNRYDSITFTVHGMEDTPYSLRFECDDNIEWDWGKHDDEHYYDTIVELEATQKSAKTNKATLYLEDDDDNVLYKKVVYIYSKGRQESEFEDRNKNGITVYVDGEKLGFDVQPRLINSRTMVPMRAIFEALGAMVNWDNDTQTAFGETVDDFVEISIGDNYLLRNGDSVYLDSPAVVISGRTLVPVRAIAESLNCDVEWIGDLQVVNITSLGNDYSNDMVVGTWKFIGFIDDFDDIEYYEDEEFRTFKFYNNGTVKITDNNSNSSETYDYHITKGGYIVIDLDVDDEVLIGTISPYDDELTIRSYYYTEYPEDIYWETQNGSVILRKSYNHYGRNLIEDDDGYIFEKVN